MTIKEQSLLEEPVEYWVLTLTPLFTQQATSKATSPIPFNVVLHIFFKVFLNAVQALLTIWLDKCHNGAPSKQQQYYWKCLHCK